VTIAFPVKAAEVTLAKQTGLKPCGCMNIGTISKRALLKNKNYPNVPTR
jgi:hypothetical protein